MRADGQTATPAECEHAVRQATPAGPPQHICINYLAGRCCGGLAHSGIRLRTESKLGGNDAALGRAFSAAIGPVQAKLIPAKP